MYDWKISEDVIDFAVDMSVGKYMPMQYLNRLLSEYHSNNIKTVDEAKNYKIIKSEVTQMITLSKIAKEAHVSVSTASKAYWEQVGTKRHLGADRGEILLR